MVLLSIFNKVASEKNYFLFYLNFSSYFNALDFCEHPCVIINLGGNF